MLAKDEARVLLFVVAGETAGVAAIAEASYLLASRRPLALAVQDVEASALLNGRRCGPEQAADLNRGRLFLRAMARVHGVPVFTRVEDAVHEAIRLVQETRSQLTLEDVRELLAATAWRTRQFRAETLGDGFLLWIEDQEPNSNTGNWFCAKGRPWFVHRSEPPNQVVQTLLKAALTWEEHEAREHFRFAGQPIFDPHLPLDTLLGRRRNLER
jgi:hypothetical protein